MDRFHQLMSSQNQIINYYYVGRHQCKPHHKHGPAVRNHYLIHYIHSGQGIYRTNGKTYHLHAGQGFLICPGEVMYYEADIEKPWDYTWLAFQGEQVADYLALAHLSLDNPIFTCHHIDQMEALLAKLNTNRVLQGTLSGHIKLLSYTYEFFSLLIDDKVFHTDSVKDSPLSPYIKKAIDYIYANYWHKLHVTDIAEYVGLDRKYLGTLFKKDTKQTPTQFIRSVRVRNAYELLRSSDLTITEISNSVGFSDPFQFSKVMKKALGAPPSELRKKALNTFY